MYLISVIITICTNIIAVIGLALLTGYTGMFSLGHAGFMCIGAYSAVLLNRYLCIPYVFALILGGLIAMLVSIIIGYPTLRNKLRGDYFAICMLGFGTIVRLILNNMNNPVFNGALGLSSIPQLTSLWSALGFMVVLVFFMWNFVHSQFGKNCIAVQQQEVAAEMMGVGIVKTKLLALMISAFYCGVAGGLLAFWMQYIAPASFSDTRRDARYGRHEQPHRSSACGGARDDHARIAALPSQLAPCHLRFDLRADHALPPRGHHGLQGVLHKGHHKGHHPILQGAA